MPNQHSGVNSHCKIGGNRPCRNGYQVEKIKGPCLKIIGGIFQKGNACKPVRDNLCDPVGDSGDLGNFEHAIEHKPAETNPGQPFQRWSHNDVCQQDKDVDMNKSGQVLANLAENGAMMIYLRNPARYEVGGARLAVDQVHNHPDRQHGEGSDDKENLLSFMHH